MSYQEFHRLNDAVMAAVSQGAEQIEFTGSGFVLSRSSQVAIGETAICLLFLNTDAKWQLEEWYLGEGWGFDLKPDPIAAVGRAVAESRDSEPPIPRTIQTEDGWQFHLSEPVPHSYVSADGGGFLIDEVLDYLSLPPTEQEDALVPHLTVKSWLGDTAGINWDDYAYSPNDIDMRLTLINSNVRYTGLITYYGEVEIETGDGATTWANSDRLTIAEVNEFTEIRAESLAYAPAMELGIKVTHREASPDSGQYTPSDRGSNSFTY